MIATIINAVLSLPFLAFNLMMLIYYIGMTF